MAFKDMSDMRTRLPRDQLPVGRSPKPTGASAFVAREKSRSGGRIGLMLATVGALSLGAGLGAWALTDQKSSGEQKTSANATGNAVASVNSRQTDPEAERRERSERQAIEARQRERQASEIAESEKQIEALRKRRDQLQQQVAELTAPLAPDADEIETATRELDAAKAKAARQQPIGSSAAKEALTEEAEAVDAGLPAESAAVASASRAPVPAPPSRTQTEVVAAAPVDVPTDVQPNGPVRVFIHVRARDSQARVRAQAIAEDLRRRGVEVAGIRGVPHAVRNDMVRFFYDADQSAVSTLGRALETSAGRGAPITQDFRNRRVAPKPGTLEIWLS